MSYINGTKTKPSRALYFKSEERINAQDEKRIDYTSYSPELAIKYYKRLADFERANKKALGAIKSIISLENLDRFKDKTSAKDL
ncbi:hypothetical protein WAI453_001045 [Rhynchosporium graminicola]